MYCLIQVGGPHLRGGGKKKRKKLGAIQMPTDFLPCIKLYSIYIFFSALNINGFFNIKYHARLHAYATCVGGATSEGKEIFFQKTWGNSNAHFFSLIFIFIFILIK